MRDARPLDSPDAELVRRAREGDEAAFRALWERHRTKLATLARRRLPSLLNRRISVSDVVQECYAIAFERLDAFRDEGPDAFPRWLHGILKKRIQDQLRSHLQRQKRAASREASRDARRSTGQFPAGGVTASAVASRREDREIVLAAIRELADDHRAILRLVHDAGLTLTEAAEHLGRSPEAARKLYTRAIASLSRRLPPRGSADA